MRQVPYQRSSLPELRDPHFTFITPALKVTSVCDIMGRTSYTFIFLNSHMFVEHSVWRATRGEISLGYNWGRGSLAPPAASLKGEMLSWKSRTQKVSFYGFTLTLCLSPTFMTCGFHCIVHTWLPSAGDISFMHPPLTEGLLCILRAYLQNI